MKKILFYTSFVLGLILVSATSIQAQTFTFGAAGDYANGGNFQATVNQAKANNVAFQLVLGDLAYSTVEQSWCNFWNSAGVKTAIVSGNHDSGESSAGNINTYLQYCTFTVGVPVTGTYGKQYYFDYPAGSPIARFIMIVPGLGGSFIGLNTNYSAGSAGYNFTAAAIDDARAKGIKWVIVGMHKNYISIMEKGNELGSDLIPMLINKRVDLILQGHEHGYERSKQLTCASTGSFNASCVANSGDTLSKGAGSIIHVIGTGGQGLRGINTSDSEVQYFKSYDVTTYGLGKFTVSPTQISYNFVRSAGGSFTDSFTITDNGSNPPPTSTPVPPTVTPVPTPSPTVRPSVTASPTVMPSTTATAVPTIAPTISPVPTACPSVPTNLGVANYTFNIATSSTYFLWARIMSAGDNANSFFAQVDNGCPINMGDINGMQTNSWLWINAHDGNANLSTTMSLTTGNHTLKIIGRELNTKIDKIVLVGTTCVPSGFGDNCLATVNPTATSNPTPVVTPTNTPFVTPAPTGCAVLPTTFGTASYTFSISTNSTYFLWSRIMSSGSAGNSLYAQIDSNCPIVVGDLNAMPVGTWEWVNYRDGNVTAPISLNLNAGNHTLKLTGREPNVKLDKIVLVGTTCVPTGLGDNCLATVNPTATSNPTAQPTVSPTNTPQPTSNPTSTPQPTSTPTSGGTSGQVTALDDASVNRDNPSYNYGKRNPLEADGGPQKRNVYIKFDLSRFSSVESAILKLKIEGSSAARYNVKSVSNNNWYETQINWSNRPGEGSTIAQFVANTTGATVSIDLSSYMRGKAGHEETIMIDSSSEDGLNIYSREASTGKPTLVINGSTSSTPSDDN
jgi:hypothetical protein